MAVVGASADNDAMGEWSLKNLLKGGYSGNIYAVNPRYDEVQGVSCYPTLLDLPAAPEDLLLDYARTLEQAQTYRDDVEALEDRKTRINAQFAADIKRFRELKGLNASNSQ